MTNTIVTSRKELLSNLGYNKDVTAEIVETLKAKNNKTNAKILEQIETSEFYEVIVNEDLNSFTIFSEYHVNKYEHQKMEKILNKKYITAGNIADKSGMWQTWIKLK